MSSPLFFVSKCGHHVYFITFEVEEIYLAKRHVENRNYSNISIHVVVLQLKKLLNSFGDDAEFQVNLLFHPDNLAIKN